jgi:hypothetical protein
VSRHNRREWGQIILIKEQIQEHGKKNYRCNRNKLN